jgi:hypothetical protein
VICTSRRIACCSTGAIQSVIHIQHLDVVKQPSANPLAADLLRVEYATPDDADYDTDVIGFLVRRADKWAETVAARAPQSVQVQVGRKKKEG